MKTPNPTSAAKPAPTVCYVVSHPIQYQAPLFRLLAQLPRWRFAAAFGCAHGVQATFDAGFGRVVHFGVDVLGGYKHVFVPQRATRPDIDRFLGLRLPAVGHPWGELRPRLLVLHGWRTAMMWQAALWARRRGVPYLIRGENPLFKGDRPPQGIARNFHRALLRWLLRGSAGVLTLGTANERYFASLGVPRERMFRMPYFVDVGAVRVAAQEGRARRAALRNKWGVPADAFLVIGVAKLQARKRAIDLVEALAALPRDTQVLWVGSGEMESSARARATELGVTDRFHLTGFLPAADTWELLGAADIFALPSAQEKWGLVLNEAAAAGLPILATDQCGAAEDLVVEGETGAIVPTGDVAAWARAIGVWRARLRYDADAWNKSLGAARADAHSAEAAAQTMSAAVCSVLHCVLAPIPKS